MGTVISFYEKLQQKQEEQTTDIYEVRYEGCKKYFLEYFKQYEKKASYKEINKLTFNDYSKTDMATYGYVFWQKMILNYLVTRMLLKEDKEVYTKSNYEEFDENYLSGTIAYIASKRDIMLNMYGLAKDVATILNIQYVKKYILSKTEYLTAPAILELCHLTPEAAVAINSRIQALLIKSIDKIAITEPKQLMDADKTFYSELGTDIIGIFAETYAIKDHKI